MPAQSERQNKFCLHYSDTKYDRICFWSSHTFEKSLFMPPEIWNVIKQHYGSNVSKWAIDKHRVPYESGRPHYYKQGWANHCLDSLYQYRRTFDDEKPHCIWLEKGHYAKKVGKINFRGVREAHTNVLLWMYHKKTPTNKELQREKTETRKDKISTNNKNM